MPMYIETAIPAPGGHVKLEVRTWSLKREHATQPLFAEHLNDENVRLCAERIHRLDRLLAEAFGISPDQYNADGFDLDSFLFGDEVVA